MSVVIVCSACGRANSLNRLPVSESCGVCGVAYPAAAREVAAGALAVEVTPRPLLVTLGAGFSALWAGVAVLIFAISAVGSGPYTLNGVRVSKREFFFSDVTLFFGVAIIYFGILAFLVFGERRGARVLMMLAWIAAGLSYFVVPGLPTADRILGLVTAVAFGAGAGWYLYGKENVAAYFARVEGKSQRVAGG